MSTKLLLLLFGEVQLCAPTVCVSVWMEMKQKTVVVVFCGKQGPIMTFL